MGNLTGGLQKILQNKNTVTLLGIIAGVAVLYFAYNYRVKQAINPIPVPVAKELIPPGTQITSNMIETRQVSPQMLSDGVIKDMSAVVDKYSNQDTLIPKGSLFFERQVVEKELLPANIILDYPKGDDLYEMGVTTQSTYGNSIYPGNYIDIYLRATNKLVEGAALTADADKMILEKLLENVKILAVKDSSGKAVFSNLDEERTPSMIIFSLPHKYFLLLKKAEKLRTYDTELIPVPTNESLKDEPGNVKFVNQKLETWINDRTALNE